MNSAQIESALMGQLIERSGLDQHRDYLGISKIGDCPRVAVLEYFQGHPIRNSEAYRMCFAGYEHERSVIELLSFAKAGGPEVVAPFDQRFRGHIDALTDDNDLLEIKSLSMQKFQKVVLSKEPLKKHYMQVQLYLRYGGWHQAFVIYRCRETYEHIVMHVPYAKSKADRYEEKAKLMLRFIDRGELPPCECGRCK